MNTGVRTRTQSRMGMSPDAALAQICARFLVPSSLRCRNGSVKGLTDGREAVTRRSPIVFGALAIDVAIVGEPPGSIIEQKLTAGVALMRRKKYRAGVNLIVAGPDFWCNPWRDRRRWVRPIAQIFFVHKQAKRDKSRDCNKGVQGTTWADSWWTGAHELTERELRREYWEVNTPELPVPNRPDA
jgi:hypothetical protein